MHYFRQVLGLICLSSCIYAQPSDPAVMAGFATFDTQANSLIIQSADKSIIHWQEFSIDQGEQARFILPDAKATVLNRVVGNEMSHLLGSLNSNGSIFLINPNGVLVGPDGLIDTASFIASTLDLSNENFLAGNTFLFQGKSDASIINLGTINALEGDALLIGYHIDNQGAINAPGGLAGIAAGREVLIKPEGSERIFICAQVPQEVRGEKGIDHSGTIQAISSEIKADGNLYALAINYQGAAEATGVEHRDGRILLVADKGYTEFQGSAIAHNADGTGGQVHILGETLHLTDDAFIDVSGDLGGGTALIGGNYQGKDTPGPTAQLTYVEKNAEVHADALTSGDGGLVVFWSDSQMMYFGNAYARGGQESGDGGNIEVSSKGTGYLFDGYAYTTAPNGKVGKLLIDPINITISTAVDSLNVINPMLVIGNEEYSFSSCMFNPANISTMGADSLSANLFVQDIAIDTSFGAGMGCAGNGDITLEAQISRSDTNTLTLSADGNIIFNAGTGGITGSGSTILNSGAAFIGGVGSITINDGSPITTTNGSIELHTGVGNMGNGGSGSITLNSSITTASGDLTMTTYAGDIVIQPVSAGVFVSSDQQSSNGITVTFNSSGELQLLASGAFPAQIGSNANAVSCDITITSHDDIILTATNTSNGYAQIGHGGNLVTTGAIASSITSYITINTSGKITMSAGSGAAVPGTSPGAFVQIGHAPNPLADTTIVGAILIDEINMHAFPSTVTLNGGQADGCYSLIGFGGQTTPQLTFAVGAAANILPSSLGVNVDTGAAITLNGGTTTDTYAAIGFTGSSNIIFTTHPPLMITPTITVGSGNKAVTDMTLNSGSGAKTAGAYIGFFFYDTPVGTIDISALPLNFLGVFVANESGNLLLNGSSTSTTATAAIGIDADPGTVGDVGLGMDVAANNNLILNANNSNPAGGAFIQDGIGNPLNFSPLVGTNVLTGVNLAINSSTNSSAFINCLGTLFGVSLGDVILTGDPNHPAYISALRGEPFLSFDPPGSYIGYLTLNITLQNNAQIIMPAIGGPAISYQAGFNISILNGSSVKNLTSTGMLDLVVDALFPNSPDIGSGQFTLDATSIMQGVPGNQLRIYTARYPQNFIDGLINGVHFSGTRFVDDNQNLYGTYFPNGDFVLLAPFYRVYYKELGLTAALSMFQGVPDLQLYDQEERWDKAFTVSYDSSFMPMTFLNNWQVLFPIDLAKDALYKLYRHVGSPKGIEAMDFLWSGQLFGTECYFERFKKHLLNQDPF